ncbi:hypothetical protein ONA91_23050 [Micromonospora sp. DR5-3]|uniref:hypothetical protein n=1 Tax=unclassified Micromonospora TaxID=2617518 RepID=UPI0011D735D0|nr:MULTISPECIES: hypothetical protein [unclassified Micromonospora]MCW3817334.1 hypothetical protein [Micromonospora sp. DR5-3]TYC24037.1 hypothetical protein FXF52_12310 [Micromonospora sp. MP36]
MDHPDSTPPADVPPRPTRRGRSRSGPLTWIALACALAVLVAAAWDRRREPVSDRTVGEVTRVGVADGDAIPAYLRASAAELAALTGSAGPGPGDYALVSFASYLTPAQLATALGATPVSAVVARVPLPGRQTEIVRIATLRVPDDVVAGMAEVAARKDREAADYRSRAIAPAATADPELRRVYDTGATVSAEEAAAYRSACACVYAAVVRDAPAALRALATRPGVRGVDPAPEVRRLDRTVFTPPLPEQEDVARPPVDTGLAGPTPGATGVGDSSEAAPTVRGSAPSSGGPAAGPGPPIPAPTS